MLTYTLKLISCRKVIWLQPGSIPGVSTNNNLKLFSLSLFYEIFHVPLCLSLNIKNTWKNQQMQIIMNNKRLEV